MHFSLMDCLKQKKQSLLVFTLNPAFPFEEGKEAWILKLAGSHYILFYILNM